MAEKIKYFFLSLKLHPQKDEDIIKRLNKEGNKQGWIKEIIRKYDQEESQNGHE